MYSTIAADAGARTRCHMDFVCVSRALPSRSDADRQKGQMAVLSRSRAWTSHARSLLSDSCIWPSFQIVKSTRYRHWSARSLPLAQTQSPGHYRRCVVRNALLIIAACWQSGLGHRAMQAGLVSMEPQSTRSNTRLPLGYSSYVPYSNKPEASGKWRAQPRRKKWLTNDDLSHLPEHGWTESFASYMLLPARMHHVSDNE